MGLFSEVFGMAACLLSEAGYSNEQIEDAFRVIHGDWRFFIGRIRRRIGWA